MGKILPHFRTLASYFLLSYALLLINASPYLRGVDYVGFLVPLFMAMVYLTYCLAYLAPVFVLTLLADAALSLPLFDRLFRSHASFRSGLVYGVAVLSVGLVQLLIFVDRFVVGIWGFHLNGFVWNLVTTSGGIASLGLTTSAVVVSALLIGAFFAVQAALLIALLKLGRVRAFFERAFTRRIGLSLAGLALLMAISQSLIYGMSRFRGYGPIVVTADAFPFYVPLSCNGVATKLGFKGVAARSVKLKADASHIRYPQASITRAPERKPYNIVWMVGESWRWDMLDPQIMPATWAFAHKAVWFKQHYTGGTRTARALFSMFYGLFGNYWSAFLREQRGPVIMDLLLQDGYQMSLHDGAKFSYPELDQTVFSKAPRDVMFDFGDGPSWQRDRKHTDQLVDFIRGRDSARPFFAFMFFDSPHARYDFPPENAIRKPYLEDVNYLTMNLNRDADLLRNRYINSCNHLDSQIARVLNCLEEQKLLDSTVVIIVGDHGEEFMEKGRWGHGSAFTDEQTRVPMILWIPGQAAREVQRLTCHMDIPATLLPLLGVTNPAGDYSQGADMLADQGPGYCVICGAGHLGYVDGDCKVVFSMESSGIGFAQQVTTRNDVKVPNPGEFLRARQERILGVLGELKKFGK